MLLSCLSFEHILYSTTDLVCQDFASKLYNLESTWFKSSICQKSNRLYLNNDLN